MPTQTVYEIAGYPRYEFHVITAYEGAVWDVERERFIAYSNVGRGRRVFTLFAPDGKTHAMSLARVACLAQLGYPPTHRRMRPYLRGGKVTKPMWVSVPQFMRYAHQNIIPHCTYYAIQDYVYALRERGERVNQSAIAERFAVGRKVVWKAVNEMGGE